MRKKADQKMRMRALADYHQRKEGGGRRRQVAEKRSGHHDDADDGDVSDLRRAVKAGGEGERKG